MASNILIWLVLVEFSSLNEKIENMKKKKRNDKREIRNNGNYVQTLIFLQIIWGVARRT